MRLLGRDEEREALGRLLEGARVVAVIGPAGVGKSALARSVGGAAWVDLEGVGAGEAVDERVAVAVGAAEVTAAAIRAALAGVGCLVLDGAEDALHALAPRLEAWGVRTLLTSRRAPDVAERVLELGPLPDAAGADLLRRGVRSARRAEALDEGGLRTLSRAFDGVPLALELLAPRLALYGPEELAERVRLEDLEDPRRRPRHRSLHRALEACAAPLSADARRLLGHVALLAGPLDRPTAEALVGEPTDLALLELIEAALLHPLGDEPPRFRLLAPVRAMAKGWLSPAEVDEAVARLAEVVLPECEEAAEALNSEGAAAALSALVEASRMLELLVERGAGEVRLRAALLLAARERRTGPFAATLARDERILEEGPQVVRWGLLVAAAASQLRDVERARAALKRVEPWVGPEHRAAWLSMRGVVAEGEGRLQDAVALHREAVALSDDPQLAYRLGVTLFWMGAHEEAAEWLQTASHARRDRFGWVQASVVGLVVQRALGVASRELLASAVPVREQAEQAGFLRLQPMASMLEGVLRLDLGDLDGGVARLQAAVQQFWQLGEHEDAFMQGIQAQTAAWLRGEVPVSLLEPQPGEDRIGSATRANLTLLRGIVLACQGAHAPALARCREGLAGLPNPELRSELAAYAAAAFGPIAPAAAAEMLAEVGERPPGMRALAEAAVRGERVVPEGRWEQATLAALAARHAASVVVARDGRWFKTADGEVVDLTRRKVLRRMVEVLVAADRPLGVDDIVPEVWPGERMVGGSGVRRVHVAISSLRGLGLRPVLRTVDDGDGARWVLEARVGEPEEG